MVTVESKGGITGLPFDDFYIREKSGVWDIIDHYQNVNYIRDSDTPNNYLAVGSYDEKKVYIYNLYLKAMINSDLFSLPGLIHSIDYNPEENLLVVGSDKPPYLLIINTETFTPINNPSSLVQKPIHQVKFNNEGTLLVVSNFMQPDEIPTLQNIIQTFTITKKEIKDEKLNYNNYNIVTDIIYEFKSNNRLNEIINTNINKTIITSINFTKNDDILAITYYSDYKYNKQNKNQSIILFKYNYSLNLYQPHTSDFNITKLPLNLILSLTFIEPKNLLFLTISDYPYFLTYDYKSSELVYPYLSSLQPFIKTRINKSYILNDNENIFLILNKEPFLIHFNLKSYEVFYPPQNFEGDISKSTSSDIKKLLKSEIIDISFTLNEEYLVVLQIEYPYILIFEFQSKVINSKSIIPIQPSFNPLSLKFFSGPLIQKINM